MSIKFKMNLIGLAFLTVLNCSSGGDDSTSGEDTEAPSNPKNLVATNLTETTVDLTWDASTDNVNVLTYLVYQNDNNLASNTSTSYSVNSLSPNTTYTFKVQAKDNAGNTSSFSNVVSVTTLDVDAELKYESGSIEAYLGTFINSVPGSSGNDYFEPTDIELDTWDLVVKAVLNNNITEAVEMSALLDYQIKEFTDNTLSPNQTFYIIEKQPSKFNHWGTYVFSKTPSKENLVITAPHVISDANTGKQAAYCFRENIAKAVFLSGTHRCNNSNFTACSGTTTVCNSSSEAYRISDMAHNVQSIFQRTSEVVSDDLPNTVFIQLHGFTKLSTDPYVIMSNGARQTPTVDYATLIKNELLVEDNTLTFKIAHIDTDWSRLIGFTNTQSRYMNNSSNPCSTSATNTTGRFIHIEQERTKLRNDVTGWKKMSEALKRVF
ncbi:fibronectin type III domain-containing protein [Pseudalgibacter alginicilyticus]|nr:fibronectin type III domain-containing protein [Pseudalgibacter alginicilyticus]